MVKLGGLHWIVLEELLAQTGQQWVLRGKHPTSGIHPQLSIPFIIYPSVLCQGIVFIVCRTYGLNVSFGMFVLCPSTWRINTYTKAIAHMLRFGQSIHVYMPVRHNF